MNTSTGDDLPERVTQLEQAREQWLDDARLIRNQVDAIQTTLGEEKPWLWRNAPLVISIVALLISTGFSTYSVLSQKDAEVIAKRNEIRILISNLIDIDHNSARDSRLIQDEATRDEIRYAKASKKELILGTIYYLEQELPEPLSFVEYSELSTQEESLSLSQERELYFIQRAVAVAKSIDDKLLGLAFLGSMYYEMSDREAGAEVFERAVQLVAGIQDAEKRLREEANARIFWANTAFDSTNPGVAFDQLQLATDSVLGLPAESRNRLPTVEHIQEVVQGWRDLVAAEAIPEPLRRNLRMLEIEL